MKRTSLLCTMALAGLIASQATAQSLRDIVKESEGRGIPSPAPRDLHAAPPRRRGRPAREGGGTGRRGRGGGGGGGGGGGEGTMGGGGGGAAPAAGGGPRGEGKQPDPTKGRGNEETANRGA